MLWRNNLKYCKNICGTGNFSHHFKIFLCPSKNTVKFWLQIKGYRSVLSSGAQYFLLLSFRELLITWGNGQTVTSEDEQVVQSEWPLLGPSLGESRVSVTLLVLKKLLQAHARPINESFSFQGCTSSSWRGQQEPQLPWPSWGWVPLSSHNEFCWIANKEVVRFSNRCFNIGFVHPFRRQPGCSASDAAGAFPSQTAWPLQLPRPRGLSPIWR